MNNANELRQGIGEELWINLPAHKRERKYVSPGDMIGPCGKIAFRENFKACVGDLHPVMCQTCKAAK